MVDQKILSLSLKFLLKISIATPLTELRGIDTFFDFPILSWNYFSWKRGTLLDSPGCC